MQKNFFNEIKNRNIRIYIETEKEKQNIEIEKYRGQQEEQKINTYLDKYNNDSEFKEFIDQQIQYLNKITEETMKKILTNMQYTIN